MKMQFETKICHERVSRCVVPVMYVLGRTNFRREAVNECYRSWDQVQTTSDREKLSGGGTCGTGMECPRSVHLENDAENAWTSHGKTYATSTKFNN